MPERTEKEIAAKNKKIKTIETEIDRLKKLGLEEEKFMSPKEERDYQFVTYEKLIEPDLKAEAKEKKLDKQLLLVQELLQILYFK